MKEKKFRFVSRSSDSRSSVVIFHIAMICSVCVCIQVIFFDIGVTGPVYIPFYVHFIPIKQFFGGSPQIPWNHQSTCSVPPTRLWEPCSSITWSVFVSLTPGTVPDMHACIYSTPMYQSSAGCCVLGTQQWMKRGTVTTVTELTDELKRHINHIIKQIM